MKKTAIITMTDDGMFEMRDKFGMLLAGGHGEAGVKEIQEMIRDWNYDLVESFPPASDTEEEVLEYYEINGYRETMMRYHPDHGGLTWQAQQTNRIHGK